VCEGKKTEPNYFKAFRDELKLTEVDVMVVGEGAAPITVVNDALDRRNERKKEVKKEQRKGHWSSIEFDEVWCVFDVERLTDNPSFHQAVNKAQANKLELAISNPAFEYWYLLHFEYTTRPFANADEVVRALKALLPDYAKSRDVFSELYPHTDTAIERAKRVLANRPDSSNLFPNPSTWVFRLVETLKAMSIESMFG